jgi:ABC-type branched-subunit amino acid transport system ATPase component
MQDPQLLLLDEPVAGTTDEETERTVELFLSLEGRPSLMVVDHDMRFAGELEQRREIFGRLTAAENLRMDLATKPGGAPIPPGLFESGPKRRAWSVERPWRNGWRNR